jgi:hypothetical protein
MAQRRVTLKKSVPKSKKSATRKSKKSTARKSKAAVTRKSGSPKQKKAQLDFGVTRIKSITNFSASNAELTNIENGDVENAPANDTTPSSIDIPWADNRDQFIGRHLVIEMGGRPKYYLFQSHGTVQYCLGDSPAAYNARTRVPGFFRGDGDRILILRSGDFEIQRTG